MNSASVTAPTGEKACIADGLLVLLGIRKKDSRQAAAVLAKKIAALRIFQDDSGKMNLSAAQNGLEILVVSNFTLYADCKKGNRPSFDNSAPAREAESLYLHFTQCLSAALGQPVKTGFFGAEMKIEAKCDGPVTIVLDSEDLITGENRN